MAIITASVGRNGVNRNHDVVAIQKLLNTHIGKLTPLASLKIDGRIGAKTIAAIEDFQRRIVKLPLPDGRIDPAGRTLNRLIAPVAYPGALTPQNPTPAIGGSIKSGTYWVGWASINARNSNLLDQLTEPFHSHARAFIAALETAGASVNVRATLRHPKRAYLFHWCWKVGLGKCEALEVPVEPGVPIQWDHGNQMVSRQGAMEMVTGFKLAVPPKSIYPPSLTSRHVSGNAVDMDIRWNGIIHIQDKTGVVSPVAFMSNVNANTTLHQIGASYGVKKLKSDDPHWSDNGR